MWLKLVLSQYIVVVESMDSEVKPAALVQILASELPAGWLWAGFVTPLFFSFLSGKMRVTAVPYFMGFL